MFKVSPLFGDHAILPLGKELRIFGTADEGETIRATLTAADGAATGEGVSIAREGRFLIHLPPQKVSAGPLTLSLTSDSAAYTAHDLQVGYVFMAGGQSNMEWGLWNAEGGQEIIKTHDDPDLRYFNVPRVSVLDEAGLAAHDAVFDPVKSDENAYRLLRPEPDLRIGRGRILRWRPYRKERIARNHRNARRTKCRRCGKRNGQNRRCRNTKPFLLHLISLGLMRIL